MIFKQNLMLNFKGLNSNYLMFTSCYAWFGGAIAFNNGLKSYVADTSSPITRTSRLPKLKQDKVFKALTEQRSKIRELSDHYLSERNFNSVVISLQLMQCLIFSTF